MGPCKLADRVTTRRLGLPLVCVLLIVLCTHVHGHEDSVREQMRTLRSQLDQLLERRQEDFRVLEDTIRQSVDKSGEVVALKHEFDKLRREVEHLRSEKAGGSHQKNDHLTVQWLSTAVTELRAEMAEIAVAVNISADLQSRHEITAGLDLLRGDLASFRRDLEELRAEQQQTVVTLGQLKQDVDASVRNSQGAVGLLTETKAEMAGTKDNVNELTKSLHKLRRQLKLVRTTSKQRRSSQDDQLYENHISASDDTHLRHHHILREQLTDIQRTESDLENRQTKLDRLLRDLEDRVSSFTASKDLESRIVKLEGAEASADRRMFNVSKHVAELDRLRLSLLQLLESLETLETKVDSSLPNLQREISKIEFGAAQTTSTVAALEEDLKNQQSSVKALGSSVQNLQEKMEVTVTGLQAQLQQQQQQIQHSNNTYNYSSHTYVVAPLNVSTLSNNTLLPNVFASLRQMQADYHTLVHQLPFDCGSIRGPNGVYPIAPGEGPPLLAFCDSGWTAIQRRIDGSEDFNRKWNDYAVGFGTPADEFWLGNEALHRLTADNCSSLRIDLTDIYGKTSAAEYDHFYIGPSSDGFRISVAGYHGNASDALDYQNHMQFSTVDSDRDISNSHCAANYEGGWWFSHCQHANLNGRYNLGLTWFDGARNEWIAVAVSEMKVRRRNDCGKT